MIQVQNKTLTIWLLHKVYCRLLTTFVYPLQAVEDNDVGKKFSCTPLQSHRINSSDLPEVFVVTSVGSNPALAFSFCRPFAAHFLLLFSAHTFLSITSLHVDMYMEAHFK